MLMMPAVRAADSSPAETWVVDGRTYEHVRVKSVNAGTVLIVHRGGITQFELEKLPPELQARFGYDPQRSSEWREQAAAGLDATRVAQEQLLATRLEASRRADAARKSREAATGRVQVQLQEEVDLRPLYSNYGLYFKDQGRRPSCAIFALVSAIEYELARTQGLPSPLSEEFLIWATRKLQPGIPIDDGYHFQEVFAAVQTYGIPRQELMPNTFGRPIDHIKPSENAIADAASRRSITPVWYRPNDPDLIPRIVDALNNRTPVVIGMRWPNWHTLRGNFLLRDQKPVGRMGHAVTLVGYRCPDRNPENLTFIFRNSYGVDWGLGGCGFVARSYLEKQLFCAFRVSIVNQVASVDLH